jgi:hypothetical protein
MTIFITHEKIEQKLIKKWKFKIYMKDPSLLLALSYWDLL